MFASDNNVDQINRVIGEVKTYLDLKARIFQLALIEKSATILSAVVMGALVFVGLSFLLILASAAAAAALAPHVGGLPAALCIVGGVYVALLLLLFAKRKAWIVNPIVNFLAKVMLDLRKSVLKETEAQ